MADVTHPAHLGFEGPDEVENWRPLVNWILAIPQIMISTALRALRQVLMLISFFAVLFTTKIPRPLHDMIVMTLRYQWRVASYVLWMRSGYPPFDFTPMSDDTGGDPASLSVDHAEQLNRWLPLVKWFLAIPHLIVLVFLYVAGFFVGFFAFFAVLFTGRYPPGGREFLVGINRWKLRVLAYAVFLRDEYPPFSMT